MKTKIGYTLILLVLLAIMGFVAYYILVDFTFYGVRTPLQSSYNSKGSFLINPSTFLSNLYQEETNLFTPIPPISETETIQTVPDFDDFYSWSQSDYLEASVSLHRFVWKDNLKSWRLFSMDFGTICHDDPSGFNSGTITYFRISSDELDKELLDYTTHMLTISPASSKVSWGGDAYFHRPLLGWKRLAPEKLIFNANDALRIAEENGGKAFRQSVGNDCHITVFLSPNVKKNNNWFVSYYPLYISGGFDIEINPYTGKHDTVIPETEDSSSP